MALVHPNSEAQDGPINFCAPRLPMSTHDSQTSFDIPDGDVEVRRHVVSRSQHQQNSFAGGLDNYGNGANTSRTVLQKSASSIEFFRQHQEHIPPLHRTISSIVTRNTPPTKAERKKGTLLEKYYKMHSTHDRPKRQYFFKQYQRNHGLHKLNNCVLGSQNNASKNGNIVLQLVLPSVNQPDNGHSFDEILDSTNRPQSISSPQDLYSMAGTECYVNQAFMKDMEGYNRNLAQTPVSTASASAKSTSPEDKIYFFRKHLASILSSMYALFIVTLGLVAYLSDIFLGKTPLSEIFTFYLVVVAFIFILYLTIDIKRYMNKKNRNDELLQKNVAEEIELKESPEGDYHLNIKLPEAIRVTKELEHHYCYNKDRHSANFYLKIGAAGFCLGHLIHSGLLLGYQIFFLTSDEQAFYECASVTSLVLDVLYPIYSFLLLYFMFKYSNIVINRHVFVGRFGLMHCLASSLCFWIWTIIRETTESLANHHHEHKDKVEDDDNHGLSEISLLKSQPTVSPLTQYAKTGANRLTTYLNVSAYQFAGECSSDQGMNMIYRNYSPYLYPFSVEYSILVVGVLLVIWQSIGKCKEAEEMSSTRQCDSLIVNNNNHESNIVIHVDCHSANKGLFCGLVVMVLTAVSVILFLIAANDDRFKTDAMTINFLNSIIVSFSMVVSGVFAYRQITTLDVGTGHTSLLDDFLLFICIPAFFLDGILSIVPSVVSGEGLAIAATIIQVLQILIQTPLIIDGLRRCSNSAELKKKKPGRELITFLIVCNLALWLMETFEVKSHDSDDNGYDFYGHEVWTIIGHLCVPLIMFYRFHSSVCLVDIWKYAYEPSAH